MSPEVHSVISAVAQYDASDAVHELIAPWADVDPSWPTSLARPICLEGCTQDRDPIIVGKLLRPEWEDRFDVGDPKP